MTKLFFVLVAFFQIQAYALQPNAGAQSSYYGQEFYATVLKQARDSQAKEALRKILLAAHVYVQGGFDQILSSCEGKQNCYAQTSLGYDGARTFLFGSFYLVKVDSSNYGVKEMYCDRVYQNADFKGGGRPGPGITPDSAVINTEHTWPQSRFNGRYSRDLQKADLHHLFPTDSQMNSIRGSNIFGEVTQDDGQAICNASRSGVGTAGPREIFEPANPHKGHVARALFYMSIRYELPISQEEEIVLKKWNREHPVDDEEYRRNDAIFKMQHNRNPFIDHPELADQINDF
ncbi:MAG: endonuclease [Bdellovibrionaceae bacterium]|nr:endonuclease [Bdellovibrio sp.]